MGIEFNDSIFHVYSSKFSEKSNIKWFLTLFSPKSKVGRELISASCRARSDLSTYDCQYSLEFRPQYNFFSKHFLVDMLEWWTCLWKQITKKYKMFFQFLRILTQFFMRNPNLCLLLKFKRLMMKYHRFFDKLSFQFLHKNAKMHKMA
jgi:hypothetical protein